MSVKRDVTHTKVLQLEELAQTFLNLGLKVSAAKFPLVTRVVVIICKKDTKTYTIPLRRWAEVRRLESFGPKLGVINSYIRG